MAVQILKTKAASKTKQQEAEQSETVKRVERMAELKAKLDPVKPLQTEYETHRKFFAGKVPESHSTFEPYEFVGLKHTVEFGPCTNQNVVSDMAKVRKYLGEDLFFELCKINLTDLKKYLTDAQYNEVVYESKTGVRQCKVKTIE